jgi:DNA-binding NtrC family response regulator
MNEPTSILVVDDEEGIRNYLKTLLKLKGYEVSTVSSGSEAIEYFSSNPPPSLILMDILMPEVDGLETLKRLRKSERELPVIMLSCIGETRTIVEAMRSGATDYLNKPFEEAELEIAILKALDRKKLVEENKLLREQNETLTEDYRFVASNAKMVRIKELINQIAHTDVTVFIRARAVLARKSSPARFIAAPRDGTNLSSKSIARHCLPSCWRASFSDTSGEHSQVHSA